MGRWRCRVGLRGRHGNSREYGIGPVVEVTPIDEQAPGIPAQPPESAGPERRADGTFAPGNRRAAAKGGRAKGRTAKLARMVREWLGPMPLEQNHEIRPFVDRGAAFLSRQLGHLSEAVGGGAVPADAEAVALVAARQHVAHEWLTAKGIRECDPALLAQASRLGSEARQNLIAARELAVKHTQAQRRRSGPSPLNIPSTPARLSPTTPGDGRGQGDGR